MKHPQKPTRHGDADEAGHGTKTPFPIIVSSQKSRPPGPKMTDDQGRPLPEKEQAKRRRLSQWWRSMVKEKKNVFAEIRQLQECVDQQLKWAENRGAVKRFVASFLGTLVGLIVFCLICSFFSLFTARAKPQVAADTKVETTSKPKSAPKAKAKVQLAEEVAEPEETKAESQPNVSEEPPPATTPEEPVAAVAAEKVILKIIADEEVGVLGVKADSGPAGLPVTLWHGKEIIGEAKVGTKGTFNFYLDAPRIIPKGEALEVRCTLPEDQKVSGTLKLCIVKDKDGMQQDVNPTYKTEDDSFHVKLK